MDQINKCDYSFFYDYYNYDVGLVVKKMVFKDIDGEEVVLTKEDLSFVSKRHNLIYYCSEEDDYLTDSDIKKIMELMINLIDTRLGKKDNYSRIGVIPSTRERIPVYRG